ncbi:MAG: hypothetical protein F6K40_16150 [Okeania sp. SIO3I5]|uniref:hypothetical protein n=1 Tax=Okeania sp. SIO3I5 TaxID=2607805 RepID=UPI0013B7F5E9|nr:hypothetical protein [Okeania sp. SIO3I5]NEQ37713.1 hypothetical protein [Okeania sp. SIO3I5]
MTYKCSWFRLKILANYLFLEIKRLRHSTDFSNFLEREVENLMHRLSAKINQTIFDL